VNTFALILAWRPVPSVEDEITESDAKTAEGAYLGAEMDPPGKTEAWSNPATHHSGKVTSVTEDQNYPGKGTTCFQYEQSILLDGITTRDRERLCWPTKTTGQ
jgi:surface antigen